MNITIETLIPFFIVAIILLIIFSYLKSAWKLRKLFLNGGRVTGKLTDVDASGVDVYFHQYTYEFKIPGTERVWKKVADIPANLSVHVNSRLPLSLEIAYEKDNPDNSYPADLVKKSFRALCGALIVIAIAAAYCLWIANT